MSTLKESSGFEEYRKTCSIIFGNATASQLKFPNASIELQQTALTSCDGIVANQLKWLENYVDKNKSYYSRLDEYLKNYTSVLNLCMNLVSMLYDFATINIESYTKSLEVLNQYSFGVKKGEGELQGVPYQRFN